MIGAILRAQVLSMMQRRRGSTWAFPVLITLLFYAIFAFWGCVVLLGVAGYDSRASLVPMLSVIMAVMTIFWQTLTLLGHGILLDVRRMLPYPIPKDRLFLAGTLLHLTWSGEMLLVVAGLTAGTILNPLLGAAAAPAAIEAAIFLVAFNVLLAGGIQDWLQRGGLGSNLNPGFMFPLMMTLLFLQGPPLDLGSPGDPMPLPPPLMIWPWAPMAYLMAGGGVLVNGLLSLAWVGAALVFGRWQFLKTLRYDAPSEKRPTSRGSRESMADRLFRLPSRFLPDPLGALTEKELRMLARSPQFRRQYVSCFIGIPIFSLAFAGSGRGSWFMQNSLPLMALYMVTMVGQMSYWNAFGFDGSAVQGYFCWPIRFRKVLIAKNLSVVLLVLPLMAALPLVGWLARVPVTPGRIAETMAVIPIASLYWFGLGNVVSARMPRSMDPGRRSLGSNHMPFLIMIAGPLVLLPLGLAYWARAVFQSDIVFAALLAVVAALGGVIYYVGLDSAATTAVTRREEITFELAGKVF